MPRQSKKLPTVFAPTGKEFGYLPLDERMMKVLTHPKTSFPARREAAENLASPNEKRHMGRWAWQWKSSTEHESKLAPNPAVAKFSNPTTARAMLSAMDSELRDHVDKNGEAVDRETLDERRRIEEVYLAAVVKLGDVRIASNLAERAAAAKTVRERSRFAYAAHQLGDVASFRAFADDLRTGKIEVIADGNEEVDLRNILSRPYWRPARLEAGASHPSLDEFAASSATFPGPKASNLLDVWTDKLPRHEHQHSVFCRCCRSSSRRHLD